MTACWQKTLEWLLNWILIVCCLAVPLDGFAQNLYSLSRTKIQKTIIVFYALVKENWYFKNRYEIGLLCKYIGWLQKLAVNKTIPPGVFKEATPWDMQALKINTSKPQVFFRLWYFKLIVQFHKKWTSIWHYGEITCNTRMHISENNITSKL